MEMWNGEAFHALTKAEKLILLECMAQIRYAPKSAKKREKIPKSNLFKCALGHLLNKGEFGLPTKYLQERGIKGEETISKAKRKLVELGFLDAVQQGSFTKAGRFRYSDRWRTYNSGALFNEDGTRATKDLCLAIVTIRILWSTTTHGLNKSVQVIPRTVNPVAMYNWIYLMIMLK